MNEWVEGTNVWDRWQDWKDFSLYHTTYELIWDIFNFPINSIVPGFPHRQNIDEGIIFSVWIFRKWNLNWMDQVELSFRLFSAFWCMTIFCWYVRHSSVSLTSHSSHDLFCNKGSIKAEKGLEREWDDPETQQAFPGIQLALKWWSRMMIRHHFSSLVWIRKMASNS